MVNIALPASANLPGTNEREGIPMMWGYGFGWGWLLMAFGSILWIALLAVLVWALIRWLESKASAAVPPSTGPKPSGPSGPSGPSALEILQQRYARGEIDTATYDQMREHLSASPRSQYEQQSSAGVR
jgi:putative membrane protein